MMEKLSSPGLARIASAYHKGSMQQTNRCHNCGSPAKYGQTFCQRCGTSLSNACPYCGTAIGPGIRICPTCGASAGKGAPQQPNWNMQQQGWYTPQQPQGWNAQQPGGWGSRRAGWWQQSGWATSVSRRRISSTTYLLLLFLAVIVIGLVVFIILQFSAKPDTGLPTISGVSVAFKGKTSAQIVWQTDKPCSSQVEYGRTMQYGFWEPAVPQNDPSTGKSIGVTSHFITITNLKAGYTYHYRVKSKDAAGHEVISGNLSFKTDEPDPFVMPD